MAQEITRRGLMKAATSLAAGALVLPGHGSTEAQADTGTTGSRKRALRFAHLTDIHVKPEMGGGLGMAAALRHAQSLEDPPELIVTGGDGIMDALAQTQSRTSQLWDLWDGVLKNECSLPLEHCIGNHDIWGWEKEKSATTGDEPLWGKRWAMDRYGMDEPYRSFDRAGWHFIVLDSVQPNPSGTYLAALDEAQFAWLADDLDKVAPTTPVVVISHIPIAAVTPMFYSDFFKEGRTQIPAEFIHTDMHRLKDLFYQHKNVKLCLSGHMHLVDRVEYLGVTYICGGAVSGAWWGGNWHEFEEGYGVIDLYDSGQFQYQYVPYGWKPVG